MITLSVETLVSLGTFVAAFTGLAVFVRATYRELRADLKADIAGLRTEMGDGFAAAERATARARAESKADVAGLRAEVRDGLAESRADVAGLRAEVRDGFAEARAEWKADIAELRVELREGVSRVEQRVDVLDGRVYMLAVGLRPLIEGQDGTAPPVRDGTVTPGGA